MAKKTKKDYNGSEARGGVAIICFLIVIIGQLWLLRNFLFPLSELPAVFYVEMLFCLILVAGIVICFICPLGWNRGKGTWIAMILFLLYAAFSILTYDEFSAAYLTGFSPTFSSAGGALVGLKLVLTLIGVTAGMPAGPQIEPREYSRRLREKAEQQEAEWAKAAMKGARKDLQATVNRLKGSLSPEELAELVKELQTPVMSDENDPDPDLSPRNDDSNMSEKWRGWGGGM